MVTCKNYITYRKTKKYGNKYLRGLRGTKPKWVRRYISKNKFEKNETLIPDEFKLIKSTTCNQLSFNEWVERTPTLTISDVIKLKHGQHIDVAIIDRNALDMIESTCKQNTLYSPNRFFKPVKGYYVHDTGLKGKLVLYSEKDPVTIDPFEFHVSVQHGWYPLTNGILPANDAQHLFELYNKPIHWKNMPSTLSIGYRGPMILWSKLNTLPKLYY